jgi:hypothetical protein
MGAVLLSWCHFELLVICELFMMFCFSLCFSASALLLGLFTVFSTSFSGVAYFSHL